MALSKIHFVGSGGMMGREKAKKQVCVNDLLENRYRIGALLGEGGFGAVYRALDIKLNKQVAVKENLHALPEMEKQFEREANILANLSHPNLPRVTDHFFIPDQGQYLVMDFVQGEDLEAILNRFGVLPEPLILPLIFQVCDALEFLHRQSPPIIHRDIKPANIRLCFDGRVMLVDFGIAKVYNPAQPTHTGARRGYTPGYSPPEQHGGGRTDVRSDIYALGATLYHLLTGQRPPESTERASGTMMPSPRQLNSQVSSEVEQVIVKATKLEKEQRFQNIFQFRQALNQPRTFIPFAPAITEAMPTPTPLGDMPMRMAELYYKLGLLLYNNLSGGFGIMGQDYEDVIANFSQAISLAPNAYVLYQKRGEAYAANGNLDQAIADFSTVLHFDPEIIQIYEDRAKVYYQKGEYGLAIADIDRYNRLTHKYIGRSFGFGFKRLTDNEEEIMTNFSQVIRLNPDYAEAYFIRGDLYYEMSYSDNPDENSEARDRAIADFNEAIRLKPDDFVAYCYRSDVYRAQGDLPQAIADLTQAINLNPSYAKAYYERAWVYYYEKGELDQAIADLTEAIRLAPESTATYEMRAEIYKKKGELDYVLADLGEIIRLKPDRWTTYNERAEIYQNKGELDQAIADLDEVIHLYPSYEGGYYNRGKIYKQKGDIAQAITDFAQVLKIVNDSYGSDPDWWREQVERELKDLGKE